MMIGENDVTAKVIYNELMSLAGAHWQGFVDEDGRVQHLYVEDEIERVLQALVPDASEELMTSLVKLFAATPELAHIREEMSQLIRDNASSYVNWLADVQKYGEMGARLREIGMTQADFA
jgi:hypothetical protein